MPERLSDDQLTRLRDHPMCRTGWAATTVEEAYGHPNPGLDGAENWCVIDVEEDDPPIAEDLLSLNADYIAAALNAVPVLLAEIDRLRAEAEEAEMEVETRGETIDRLRAELNAMTVTAEEGLEVTGELLAENVSLRKHGCPHIVTSGEGTSHCGLAVMEMAKAIAEIEQLQAQRDDLTETVRDLADSVGGRRLLKSEADLAAHALRAGCDRAEVKD